MRILAEFVRRGALYTACTVSGHDEPDGDGESSVLCAAVSSAMQLTCNTLTECFGVPESAVTFCASEGAQNRITVRLRDPDKTQSEILHGLLLHFQLLAEDAGSRMSVRVRKG